MAALPAKRCDANFPVAKNKALVIDFFFRRDGADATACIVSGQAVEWTQHT